MISIGTLNVLHTECVRHIANKGRVLILGYPDSKITKEQMASNFGVEMELGENPILKYFQAMGFQTVEILDVSDYQEADHIRDLNTDFSNSDSLVGRFSLIIDNGVLEHCFNVGIGFFNVLKMLSDHGSIFHLNPVNWVGHGFWNMSPCVYHDFYESNGFDVSLFLRNTAFDKNYKRWEYKPRVTKILPQKRYLWHCVAKRVSVKPPVMPIQSRFRHLVK